MKPKTIRICSVVTAIMLLLYAACIFLNFFMTAWVRGIPALPAGAALNLSVTVPTVVLLIFGIIKAKNKQGIFDTISSAVTLLVCVIWLIISTLYWIFSIYYNLALTSGGITGNLAVASSYVGLAVDLLTSIVALYLLIAFAVNVIVSKKRIWQIKAELHKPVAAVLLLFPNLISFVRRLFLNQLLISMGTQVFAQISNVIMILQFALIILVALSMAAFILIFGLIIKKQPDMQSPTTEDEIELSAPPAGVSADDYRI